MTCFVERTIGYIEIAAPDCCIMCELYVNGEMLGFCAFTRKRITEPRKVSDDCPIDYSQKQKEV